MCGDDRLLEEGRQWVVLNRFAAGTGIKNCMVECSAGQGEYVWDMSKFAATGAMLCWPVCATQWIEGKMLETNVALRRKDKQ